MMSPCTRLENGSESAEGFCPDIVKGALALHRIVMWERLLRKMYFYFSIISVS